MKILILLLTATLAAVSAASDAGPAAFIKRLQAGEKITIITMGTSLTGGQWRWTDVMMAGWLNLDYTGQVTLFNEGVGASASSVGPGNNPDLSGLGKLPAVLAHKPDVVFIEFSINDAYLPYRITPEDSKKNLNTLIDRIQQADPKTEIIVQTMNPVKDLPAHAADGTATQRPRLAEYVEGYRQVAKARGLRLVDHFSNWQKLMRDNPAEFDRLVPDGVHPQGEGYWAVLLPELKRELLPPPPAAPVCYLQNPTDHGMTICLLAPTTTTREVRVSLASDASTKPRKLPAEATVIPDTAWTIWKLHVTDLQPGESYQYQVLWQNAGQPAATTTHRFRTPDPLAGTVRAIAFNDTHMGDRVVAVQMARLRPQDFDLSILLGDVLEGVRPDGADVIAAWTRYVELLDGADKPIIYVRGNHDVRHAFAKRLAYLFDLPSLDPTKPWGEEQWNYTFQAGPASFLIMDTGEDDDDRTPLESYKNPALWQRVRQRQAEWLKQLVAAKTPNTAPWRVLLCHIPLYNGPWCSARARALWSPLLTDWDPDLELSGHDHQWRPAQPLPPGQPWPSLVGGGPAVAGGEESTMMMLTADQSTLKVRLLGAKDGRKLTEFVVERPHEATPPLAAPAPEPPSKSTISSLPANMPASKSPSTN